MREATVNREDTCAVSSTRSLQRHRRHRPRRCFRQQLLWMLLCFIVFLSCPSDRHCTLVAANDGDDYYQDDDDYFKDDDDGANDDGAANDDAANDDAANDDAGDDNADAAGDDAYYNDDDDGGQADEAAAGDDSQFDDDIFIWNNNVGFDGVSVMPLSCVNYNNGHMIKFDLFDSANSYQCHFAQIGTFVVSIAHYMRAYFNYQALLSGTDFSLPGDAGFLNCIQLQETAYNQPLYAKIGCMERETFTSTKLQLHVYTDKQCSKPYDDGQSSKYHATKGYEINGYLFNTKVSFRPPFYSCMTCDPSSISGTFNKKNGNWYDDDYISSYGQKEANGGDDDENQNQDDYFVDDYVGDDAYLAANDDVRDDDAANGRQLAVLPGTHTLDAVPGTLEAYEEHFWKEYDQMKEQRKLYNDYYDIGDWNMCQRMYKYGVWCDEECQALDAFRTDQWSASDMSLLAIMCLFLTAMMMLIVAKRLKAAQKVRLYGDDQQMPGLPPVAMAIMYVVFIVVIIVMAKLKFVNETLVFAVVTCILLFIYMLKLTLFENRRPVLLAAPRHEVYDSALDARLFD